MDNNSQSESFLGYYIFVAISAMIGFFALLAFSKIAIRVLIEKNLLGINTDSNLVSIIVAIVGTILFISLSLVFKNFLKSVFLSEIFLYLYMGVLTTAINILAFSKLVDIFAKNGTSNSIGWKVAEVIAFIIAVIFAFITNKIFVFKSPGLEGVIREFGAFTIGRVVTEIINFLMMWILIDIKAMNSLLVKVLASVIVIVLNYIFSKFIIFKKKANA